MYHFIMDKIALVAEGADSRFKHVFGGPRKHAGVIPKDCKAPLHLLYTFDTEDPNFPIKIPNIRYLPLYYSFVYNAGACGYRIKSDEKIEILYMETKEAETDFPYENYPSEFPEHQVHLRPISYEEHKTLVYYINAGIIEGGIDELSEPDRKLVFDNFKYPFTQLGGFHYMIQGVPEVPCPNMNCENSRDNYSMEIFAVVWNEPFNNIFLWENDTAENDCIQVIFQICRKCHSIYACNRCD